MSNIDYFKAAKTAALAVAGTVVLYGGLVTAKEAVHQDMPNIKRTCVSNNKHLNRATVGAQLLAVGIVGFIAGGTATVAAPITYPIGCVVEKYF